MLTLRKLNLFLVYLLVCFVPKAQNLKIEELIELKRGNIQNVTNQFIGSGWSLSSVSKPEYEGGQISKIMELDYLPRYSSTVESKLFLYLTKDESVSYFRWSFNSLDTFNKLISSIKSYNFDNQWVETFERTGIHNHFEKDEIHIDLRVNPEKYLFLSDNCKFTIQLNNYFPQRFTRIESESRIIQYKKDLAKPKLREIELPSSLIYYSELKVGSKVREYNEKLKKDEIPPNDEYSVYGANGISVVVENGVITSINQRKKLPTN